MNDAVLLVEELHRGVLLVTLNRPESRNALSLDLLERLRTTVNEAQSSVNVRAIVLRGAGDKAFSAGFDLGDIKEKGSSADEALLLSTLDSVQQCSIPTIAVIDGYCIGAGLELAMCCDIRVASTRSRFCMPPARLGAVYSPQGMIRFISVMGLSWTRYLLLTAEVIDSEKALTMGIVHEITGVESIQSRGLELGRRTADELAPLSIAGTKHILGTIDRSYRSWN